MSQDSHLNFSVLIPIHFNKGVFASVTDKIVPITPVVLCLVFELLLKFLDSILYRVGAR